MTRLSLAFYFCAQTGRHRELRDVAGELGMRGRGM